MGLRERIARTIAIGMGYDFAALAPIRDRRAKLHDDPREVYQVDVLDAADAVLAELAPVLDAAREVVAEDAAWSGLTLTEAGQAGLERVVSATAALREALRRVEGEADERA